MQDNITKLAIDIGNSKIKMILGELSTDGLKLRIVDYLEEPSQGIKKSVIFDSELMSKKINSMVLQMEKRTGKFLQETVSIGISNDNICSRTEYDSIEFEEKEITKTDIKKLITKVKEKSIQEDEIVIVEEIYNVRVDNSGILKSPIGQVGTKLEGHVHLVVAKKEEYLKLVSVLEKSGLKVSDVYLNSLASAMATLKNEEKQKGVALVDIGENIVDIAIYKNDKILHNKSISIGGANYVNDISYIEKIEKIDAEKLLNMVINDDTDEDTITLNDRKYSKERILKIIDARTGDLIKFISETIVDSGFDGYLGKGLVFTGGAVNNKYIVNKIEKDLSYNVRIACPDELRNLENTEPSMSTVIGILLVKLQQDLMRQKEKKNNKDKIITKEDDFLKSTEFVEEMSDSIDNDTTFGKIKKWISNFI